MRMTKIYTRFYKSFNYDYERKYARNSQPDPWEDIEGAWYPYVRLDLESSVTTIVGANESGKTHLLDSIENLITGKNIKRSDFCRYSNFFSVEKGHRRLPDFGAEFELVDESDMIRVKKHLHLDLTVGDRFHLFRPNGGTLHIYLQGSEVSLENEIGDEELNSILPSVFRLDAQVPLPASIPLYELAPEAKRPWGSRSSRWNLMHSFAGRSWSSQEEMTSAVPGIYSAIFNDPEIRRSPADDLDRQYGLGRDLLFRVAGIEQSTFKDLSDAISAENEGYVNGLIQKINAALAVNLNFPRWWAQDRDFKLMVSPREYDIVFTIRDRTGTDYSFSERSNGLRYFLSYHVQLLAHQPPVRGQSEILLMDEPDAYLSSQGQQDLLRILEEFARPASRIRNDQVVYVTHSPFLINRNSAQRIQVLDKGMTDEGTRVVKDVARNHYEPLRSSLGAFVAETSFIGGANLFVEGLADQILLAGLSSHLLSKGRPSIDLIDLNSVTIVPSGSASSVPYLVYLARGRDVVRPPCVALLDSDSAGDDAVKTLAKGSVRGKQILPSQFVVQVGKWAASVDSQLVVESNVVLEEIEDLIPLPIAVAAARNYAINLGLVASSDADGLTQESVASILEAAPGPLFDAIKGAFSDWLGNGAHIEKVGFAKEVIGVLAQADNLQVVDAQHLADFENNASLLLANLARLLRQASREEQDRRLNNRLKRVVDGFLDDYTDSCTRERGRVLIEDVQSSVEDSDAGDRIRISIERLRREFSLDEDLVEPIERFSDFRERVRALGYQERFAKQDLVDSPDRVRALGDGVSRSVECDAGGGTVASAP
jgi:energy-coupling factor transporter ATP-binding protein EcfA2